MTKLKTLCETARRELTRLHLDDNGATAIEYAMIAAGVGAVVAGTVTGPGSH